MPVEPADTIRVLLIDDHAVVRAGVRAVIDGETTHDGRPIKVAGEAGTAAEALRLDAELRPDVAVVDLRLPDLPGVEVARRIRVGGSGAGVLVLTSFESEEDVAACVAAGALGYAVKETPADRLIEAVAVVAAGRRWLCPTASSRLAERMTHEQLTDREAQVLELAADGLVNKEIARTLGCAAGTVKVHLANASAKLRAEGRIEAIKVARERGWICDGR